MTCPQSMPLLIIYKKFGCFQLLLMCFTLNVKGIYRRHLFAEIFDNKKDNSTQKL